MRFTDENAYRRHRGCMELSFPHRSSVDEAEFIRQEKGVICTTSEKPLKSRLLKLDVCGNVLRLPAKNLPAVAQVSDQYQGTVVKVTTYADRYLVD
jgi:hypothetical protein